MPDPVAIPTLAIRGRPVEEWVRPDPAQPLVWHTRGAGRPTDVRLVPFHRVAHERYLVYFDEEIADVPAVERVIPGIEDGRAGSISAKADAAAELRMRMDCHVIAPDQALPEVLLLVVLRDRYAVGAEDITGN